MRSAGLVRVEVSDTHPGRPEPTGRPSADTGGGRGLLLVEAVAARWGVAGWPGPGKTVWAECAVHAPDDEPPKRETGRTAGRSPAGEPVERYAHGAAQGKIRLKPFTAAGRHGTPHCEVAEDTDPSVVLPAERAEGRRL
ncbi:ATP-binding protein [Streptomyces sp. NPDC004051]